MNTKTRKPRGNPKLVSIKGGREKSAETPPQQPVAPSTKTMLVLYFAAIVARLDMEARWPSLHKDPEDAAWIATKVLGLAAAAFSAMGLQFNSVGVPQLRDDAHRVRGATDDENAVRVFQEATILAQKVLSEARGKFEMTGYSIHVEGAFNRGAAFCTNGFVREVYLNTKVLWVPVALLSPLGIEIDKLLGRLQLRTFELNGENGEVQSVECVLAADLPSFLCQHDPALVLDLAAREKLMKFQDSVADGLDGLFGKALILQD